MRYFIFCSRFVLMTLGSLAGLLGQAKRVLAAGPGCSGTFQNSNYPSNDMLSLPSFGPSENSINFPGQVISGFGVQSLLVNVLFYKGSTVVGGSTRKGKGVRPGSFSVSFPTPSVPWDSMQAFSSQSNPGSRFSNDGGQARKANSRDGFRCDRVSRTR